MLAAIALDHPRAVTADVLIDRIWPHGAPATARKALHNHVARLRRSVGADLVVTTADGYRLADDVELDLDTSPGADGVPFADLDEAGPGVAAARRHAIRRRTEQRVTELGEADPATAIPSLETTLAEDPFAEEAWIALARAYEQSGRRRDAAQVFTRARRRLAGAGLALGPRLEDAERVLLAEGPHDAGHTLGEPSGGIAPSQVEACDTIIEKVNAGPTAVIAHGPAGIGRSTALEHVARRLAAAGTQVVSTRCEAEPVRPLEPIALVVDELLERSPEVVGALLDAAPLSLLSNAVAAAVGHEPTVIDPERRRLEAAVVELLCHPSLHPLCVVIDDLHWATRATRSMLAAASERATATGAALSVVAGWRGAASEATLGDITVERVPIKGLTPAEVASLGGVGPDRAERLYEATGGNPLFVRELVQAGTDPAAAPVEVPSTIAALLTARVSRLRPAAVETAAAAAVLGRHQFISDIVSMVPTASVDDCIEAGILRRVGPDQTEFDHDLLRRAVLDSLGPARRVELHDAAARAIESSRSRLDRATELAHHAVEAGALDPLGAAHHAQIAAGVHTRHGHHVEAADILGRAASVLAAASQWPARRVELLIEEGAARLRGGDTRAREVFDAALDAAGRLEDASLIGRATIELCRLGPTTESGVNDVKAVAAIDHALAVVTDRGTRARLAAAATMVHSMGGETVRCRELLDQALDDAHADGRPEVLADVLPYTYMTLSEPTDLARRMDIAAQLEEVGAALRRADVEWEGHQISFSNSLQLGLPRLRSELAHLERLAAKIRERTRDWEMHYLRSTVAQLDDDLDKSESIITNSLEFTDAVAPSRVIAVYGVHLLALRIAQDRAGELVDDLTALAADQPGVGGWHAALSLAAAHAGDEPLARRSFATASKDDFALLDRDFSYTGSLFCLGMTAGAIADADMATTALAKIGPLADRWSWVGTTTLGPLAEPVARCLSVLGKPTEEITTTAVEVARRLKAPRYTARLESVP